MAQITLYGHVQGMEFAHTGYTTWIIGYYNNRLFNKLCYSSLLQLKGCLITDITIDQVSLLRIVNSNSHIIVMLVNTD